MSFLDHDPDKSLGSKKGKVGIFLTSRHVSWALSSFVLISFFIFIAGYFLGKRNAVEKLYNRVEQDSLADQVYYSVCSLYENKDNMVQGESTEDAPAEEELVAQEVVQQEMEAVATAIDADVETVDEPEEQVVSDAGDEKQYYAELIGFGTQRAATRFVNRLKKQNFSVILKQRKSKSAQGRTITWYQVVTETFDNKHDLIACVDIIKGKERLKGIRIVQC